MGSSCQPIITNTSITHFTGFFYCFGAIRDTAGFFLFSRGKNSNFLWEFQREFCNVKGWNFISYSKQIYENMPEFLACVFGFVIIHQAQLKPISLVFISSMRNPTSLFLLFQSICFLSRAALANNDDIDVFLISWKLGGFIARAFFLIPSNFLSIKQPDLPLSVRQYVHTHFYNKWFQSLWKFLIGY